MPDLFHSCCRAGSEGYPGIRGKGEKGVRREWEVDGGVGLGPQESPKLLPDPEK